MFIHYTYINEYTYIGNIKTNRIEQKHISLEVHIYKYVYMYSIMYNNVYVYNRNNIYNVCIHTKCIKVYINRLIIIILLFFFKSKMQFIHYTFERVHIFFVVYID